MTDRVRASESTRNTFEKLFVGHPLRFGWNELTCLPIVIDCRRSLKHVFMKIAQIAPLYEAIPPKVYGARSGSSQTSAIRSAISATTSYSSPPTARAARRG